MKSRVLSGLVGAVLLAVVLLLPPLGLVLAMTAICVMAMVELLMATHLVTHRGVLYTSLGFAACTPFFMWGESRMFAFMILLVYVTVLVCIQIKDHQTLPIEHTSFAFAMSLTFPVAFSCLAYLRLFHVRDGLFYVLLALVIPWMSDMGAYFVGTFLGKHKLCPQISPKKTVEGLIGGLVVSVLSALAVGTVYQAVFLKSAATVSFWQLGLIALVCAGLSVLGDLFASLIKRQCHVKDFGNIMPGHGGIMDRFDSLLLSVPLLYIVVHFLPLIY